MNIEELMKLGHESGYEVWVCSRWNCSKKTTEWSMWWEREAGAASLKIRHSAPTLEDLAETFPLPPDAEALLRPATAAAPRSRMIGSSS